MVLIVDTGQVSGADGQQQRDAPSADEQAQDAADGGKKDAFGEKLADQMSAAGADGGTDGDFALAPGGAGEQKIRDVGAGDQQDEAHRSHQDQQGQANVAN